MELINTFFIVYSIIIFVVIFAFTLALFVINIFRFTTKAIHLVLTADINNPQNINNDNKKNTPKEDCPNPNKCEFSLWTPLSSFIFVDWFGVVIITFVASIVGIAILLQQTHIIFGTTGFKALIEALNNASNAQVAEFWFKFLMGLGFIALIALTFVYFVMHFLRSFLKSRLEALQKEK